MSGISYRNFRCTEPLLLGGAAAAGGLAEALDWQKLSQATKPAPIVLRVGVGRGFDFWLSSEVMDLTTMGRVWRQRLESRSVHPSLLALLNSGADPKQKIKSNLLNGNFYVFQFARKRKKEISQLPVSAAWADLLSDAVVLAKRTNVDNEQYAVILSNSFKSMSICVKLPVEEVGYITSPEQEMLDLLRWADRVSLTFESQELQEIAFQFTHDLNVSRAAKCQKALSTKN